MYLRLIMYLFLTIDRVADSNDRLKMSKIFLQPGKRQRSVIKVR